MASKRKAREAFGKPAGQLSAFAAAKLAKQKAVEPKIDLVSVESVAPAVATLDAAEPFNGRSDRSLSSAYTSADDTVEIKPTARNPTFRLSSFEPSASTAVYNKAGSLEVTLRADETIAFVGEYDVEAFAGIATVYGVVLRPNTGARRVYAPSTQALPLIHARQDSTSIRVSPVKSGLRKLTGLSPLFRNIWNSSDEDRSFTRIGTSDDDPLERMLGVLEIDPRADIVLRTLSAKVSIEARKPRIMAVGAKSSGKSTFNRVLCNHLLSWTQAKKIMYIDLDPGQPEFGPPGQVSLVDITADILGPPFTHPASSTSSSARLIRSHTIAATTFKEHQDLYMACAADLARHVSREAVLIVNSSGWVTGLGAAAIVELVDVLHLTDLVLLEPLDYTLVESLQSRVSEALTCHRIPRQPPRPSPRTPAESRAMHTMSYLHHRPSHTDTPPRWSGKPLREKRTWEVSYTGPNPGIAAVLSYGQAPHPDYLAEVLDGSIVAIVIADPDADDDQLLLPSPDGPETPPSSLTALIARTPVEEIPYIQSSTPGAAAVLNPAATHCLGLALVHGIDTDTRTLHLHTPLSQPDVAELAGEHGRVFLVRGAFDCPEWAYLEDLHARGGGGGGDAADVERGERPWVSRGGRVGVEGAVWRLRHPPAAAAAGGGGGGGAHMVR